MRSYLPGTTGLAWSLATASSPAFCASVGQGNLNGLLGDSADRFGSYHVTGRKSPCPFDKHANAETEALRARDILNLLLASEDRFIAIAIDADIGVSGAQFFGPRDGNVG